MNPSSNLFLIGPSGAGKTSIGRRVAEHFALPFADLDHEIEDATGVDIPTIFDIEGEAGFRKRESDILDTLSRSEGIVLATGAGAILDPDNRQCLSTRGFVLWLDAHIEQLLKRLAHARNRPLLDGVDRRRRFSDMAAVRTPLYRATADLRIPGRNEAVTHAAQRVIDQLTHAWHPPRSISGDSHAKP